MRKFNIIDTTLRDGEQTAGVNFSFDEKLKIVKELNKIGVKHIEIGIPAMGEWEIKQIKKIVKLGFDIEYTTWNRLNKADIDKAVECGIPNIHISIPISDIHIEKKLKTSRELLINKAEYLIAYAKSCGCNVYIGFEDASRADPDFMITVLQKLESLGVTRFRFADTMSALNPFTTTKIIKKIKNSTNLLIDFHGHNDFGMATANALAAFQAGADFISTSANGIGERAGNVPLEEIVAALKYFENFDCSLDMTKFVELARIVEDASGIKLAKNKPIIGEVVFSHESGIHADGLIKSKDIYEFLNPQDFGRENKIIFGKHSGRETFIKILQDYGIKFDSLKIEILFNKLRKMFYFSKNVNLEKILNEIR